METITRMPETAEPRKADAHWADPHIHPQDGKSDAEMMYARSLGVTETAQPLGEETHEECPPEVYIG